MSHQNKVTSIHGLLGAVVNGLHNAGITVLSNFQRALLTYVVGNRPDMLCETEAGCGRFGTMVAWTAQCILKCDESNSSAVIVCQNENSIKNVDNLFGQMLLRDVRTQRIDKDSNVQFTKDRMVFICTRDSVYKITDHKNLRSLCVENIDAYSNSSVVELLELYTTASSNSPLCLLVPRKPSGVHPTIRYFLRRGNRRFMYSLTAPGTHYTQLLASSHNDRSELCGRLLEMQGMQRVLVLTHNKEVRDLKSSIQSQLPSTKVLSLQRSTPQAERQKVLSEFLGQQQAILVGMDAFTGIDLVDVDAVIQYYPPQKSMTEEEWDALIACYQTTSSPDKACLVVTLVGSEDVGMVAYFQQNLGDSGPILNLSPKHPQFAELVWNPFACVEAKVPQKDRPAALVGSDGDDDDYEAVGSKNGGGKADEKRPGKWSKDKRDKHDDDNNKDHFWQGGKRVYKK